MTARISHPAGPTEVTDGLRPRLEALSFEDLDGFAEDDHFAAWAAFSRTCRCIARQTPVLRPAVPPERDLLALARVLDGRAAPRDRDDAMEFFKRHFQPFEILGAGPDNPAESGFLTGYYEPLVDGSLVSTPDFTEPILRRPDDLLAFLPGETPFPASPDLSAAQRLAGDCLAPYPDRAAIEAGAVAAHTKPIVWLRDAIEVFMVQVQGSAKVRLPDGLLLRLTYAGRNGQPYSSIGRILIEEGHIAATDMSLASLKAWVRAHGQRHGEAGRAVLQKNRSYVFFEARDCDDDEGPIGGAGVALSPLRSIAVDRRIWAYGLPFWIETDIPWQNTIAAPFRRLMIAQDTGSAILGSARADLFFGSGDLAGHRAGGIRHQARMIVFLPRAGGTGT